MNNIIKTGLLTLVFTVITMGLFGISTTSMVGDVFGEKDQQGKNSNTEVEIWSIIDFIVHIS